MNSPAPGPGETADKAVVVAGGAGGIGRGVVAALMAGGAKVASLDLADNPAASLPITCDVTDQGAVESALAKVTAELGVPTRRVGAVGVVVDPIMFVLSDAARYLTGQVLHVNGGMLMP